MIKEKEEGVQVDVGRRFEARPIDDDPRLLEQSYRLRYQVYCLERKFLPAENFPGELEFDEFDRHSIHVGAVDSDGALAGTARIVTCSDVGLPLFRHCTTFPEHRELQSPDKRIVETGRLAVSRSYRRRADDNAYGASVSHEASPATHRVAGRRRGREQVFLTLLKALYQATKRIGATHWLVAIETSLDRLLAQQGFPFRVIGPESDYLGLITPYQLNLRELDAIILSRRFPALDEFVVGLEPEFGPQAAVVRRAVAVTDPPAAEASVFDHETEFRVLSEFRRAAANVPAYRALLQEHGVHVEHVRDLASFTRICPLLSKQNTFSRFPLDQLSVGGSLLDVADVLTSSGHGGTFSFGVTSKNQAAASARFMDHAFDEAFGITSRKTLVINCLPMGVIFTSHCMTVATTSVREDMVAALVDTFGHHYDQIVLVGDPLFMKRLTDYASERGLDWSRHRMNAIIGEEIFGEHFRGYVAACLGLTVDDPDRGYIMSSFGVGELGLHLCYETPATINLRRASFNHARFARELLGVRMDGGDPLPMIFSFDPWRTFIEVVEPDENGYGRMTMTMLDDERTVPLLRYQTGDIVRLLDPGDVADVASRYDVTLAADLPRTLLALRGREREALPNGSHVAVYKDALYADHRIARHLTGAFRVTFSGVRCTLHVQLVELQSQPPAFLEQGILEALPAHMRPDALVLWAYAQFPFGMRLDYERKFSHYVVAEPELGATGCEPPTREHAPDLTGTSIT